MARAGCPTICLLLYAFPFGFEVGLVTLDVEGLVSGLLVGPRLVLVKQTMLVAVLASGAARDATSLGRKEFVSKFLKILF